MFKDRIDAGRQLADKLAEYKRSGAIICALPRGGVVLGYEIARALQLHLDIVVARKVGHPDNPEYAIAAVDESGNAIFNTQEISSVDQAWLVEEMDKQRAEAKRRIILYRGNKKPISLQGKTVIIVDDGVATGLTLKLAIASVQKQKPKCIIVAVPVIPPDVAEEIEKIVDELVVLEPHDDSFSSVGAYYERFPQVGDDDVVLMLEK